MQSLDPAEIERAVALALREDIGSGDVTTTALVPADARAAADMIAREDLVLAGLPLAAAAFRHLDPEIVAQAAAADGQQVPAGAAVLRVSGLARPLLTAERVALNFVQRLSGIATLTARFVAKVKGTRAQILDTRKTTPGWRRLEKYAVACGGGINHRLGLFDRVLIKDNHLAVLRQETPLPAGEAVRRARAHCPHLLVELEIDSLAELEAALAAGPDRILLDNFGVTDLREAVGRAAGRVPLEASGGVTLETVRAIAETGVDFISIGALTHSARSVDLGLDFIL